MHVLRGPQRAAAATGRAAVLAWHFTSLTLNAEGQVWQGRNLLSQHSTRGDSTAGRVAGRPTDTTPIAGDPRSNTTKPIDNDKAGVTPSSSSVGWRVDNMPWYLSPAYEGISTILAQMLYWMGKTVAATSTITFEGRENLAGSKNHIFVHWHYLAYVVILFGRGGYDGVRSIFLNHPAWYMRPTHKLLKYYGNDLVLGSTGNSGKEAAERVIQHLKEGASTTMFPDGPYGPPKEIKNGVLWMGLQSGVPLIPVTFDFSKARTVRANSWDKKIFVLPFSTIVVKFGKPIYVTKETMAQDKLTLAAALNAAED